MGSVFPVLFTNSKQIQVDKKWLNEELLHTSKLIISKFSQPIVIYKNVSEIKKKTRIKMVELLKPRINITANKNWSWRKTCTKNCRFQFRDEEKMLVFRCHFSVNFNYVNNNHGIVNTTIKCGRIIKGVLKITEWLTRPYKSLLRYCNKYYSLAACGVCSVAALVSL